MLLPKNVTQDSEGRWWYSSEKGYRQQCFAASCTTCGQGFIRLPGRTSDVCSFACARWTCQRCGVIYTPTSTVQKFCTRECQRGSATCEECGTEFAVKGHTKGRFCTTECAYENRVPTGSRQPYGNGYWMVKVPVGTLGTKLSGNRNTRWMLEHRYVMGQKLGRPVDPIESVHHINGDRADNRPENLQLRRKAHGAGVVLACLDCGSQNVGKVAIS